MLGREALNAKELPRLIAAEGKNIAPESSDPDAK